MPFIREIGMFEQGGSEETAGQTVLRESPSFSAMFRRLSCSYSSWRSLREGSEVRRTRQVTAAMTKQSTAEKLLQDFAKTFKPLETPDKLFMLLTLA